MKAIFQAVAKQELVPKHILHAVENRLAGNKPLPWNRQCTFAGDCFSSGDWFHSSYIGGGAVELQSQWDTVKRWAASVGSAFGTVLV